MVFGPTIAVAEANRVHQHDVCRVQEVLRVGFTFFPEQVVANPSDTRWTEGAAKCLGDSKTVIPKIIRENKHVINFPKTNNKCVFHCIAWNTFQSAKKDPSRIQAQVKEAFKRYCFFKGITYTLILFRSFKPVDLPQLDEVEDCFQLGINVYSIVVASGNVECIDRTRGKKLWIFYHTRVTLSTSRASICFSLTDSLTEEVRCFVNDDPKMLLMDMFKYIGDVSVKIQQYNVDNSLGFGKQRFDYGRLKQQIDQVPLFGFNSGRYDINLIKSDLFAHHCYDKYITTYLGGCKCDDKIRCVCGLGKGIFPYEYITAFNVLNQTTIPPKSAFESKLRGTSITNDDYERVKFVWGYYGMKSIMDLLVWYNNLDLCIRPASGSSIRNFNVRIGSQQTFHHFTNELAKIVSINGDLTPELVNSLLDYQTWSLTNRVLIADVSRLTERDVPQAIQVQGVNAGCQGTNMLVLVVS
ncbi:unnamed protein product [Phytophthora lilii]|uniref:Unnamed protein product n=1 Tax=Phytophthora lilii TaxID=2077276 RepID=A0A9W6TUD5_9STRA|nr:unnamed protein product [Phytophthora lilii]